MGIRPQKILRKLIARQTDSLAHWEIQFAPLTNFPRSAERLAHPASLLKC